MTRNEMLRRVVKGGERLQEKEAVEFQARDFILDPDDSICVVRRLVDTVQNEMAAIIHLDAV